MMNHADQCPDDKHLRHCREWLTTTLLIRTGWKALSIAGLLAGETILLLVICPWVVSALFSGTGAFLGRLSALCKAVALWTPLMLVASLLSLIAAHSAQWGEQNYRRGPMAAAFALAPAAPLIFGIFLASPMVSLAPMLATLVLWLLGSIWWHFFLFYLRRLTDFDYRSLLERESQPVKEDWLYDQRQYLEIKKTSLIERKQRWKEMVSSDLRRVSDPALQPEPKISGSTNKWLYFTGGIMVMLIVGSLLLPSARRVLSPAEPDVASKPKHLVFWYEAVEPEASLIQALIANYAQKGPVIQGLNQIELSLEVHRAYITGNLPDIMLVPTELAYELEANWTRNRLQAGSGGSTQLVFTLWPDIPWRQRLALVIVPTTAQMPEAQDFVAYLGSQLAN